MTSRLGTFACTVDLTGHGHFRSWLHPFDLTGYRPPNRSDKFLQLDRGGQETFSSLAAPGS